MNLIDSKECDVSPEKEKEKRAEIVVKKKSNE